MAADSVFMAVLKMPLEVFPNSVSEPTITRKIRAQIRPYSMAVAPPSSRIRRVRNVFRPASPVDVDQSRSHNQATSGSSAGGMG